MSEPSKDSPTAYRLGKVEIDFITDDSVKDCKAFILLNNTLTEVDAERVYEHVMFLQEHTTRSALVYRCNTDTLNKLKDEINHTIKGKRK